MAKPKARGGKRAAPGPAPRPDSEDLRLADECRRLALIPFPQPARFALPATVDLRTGPCVVQLVGLLVLAVGLMSGTDADSTPRPKPTAPTTTAPTPTTRTPGTVIDPMTLPDAKPKPPARNTPARPRVPSSAPLPGRR